MKNRYTDKISKFLSFVLRHEPESIGLSLDSEGWADISTLLRCAQKAGRKFTRDELQVVVDTNDKKRFSLSEDGLRIRAAQGHSLKGAKVEYAAIVPPERLYHGTATRFLDLIYKQGLVAGSRQYVHLSGDTATAVAVGKRHGTPVILVVEAQRMHELGFVFHQADNGVWLVDGVPAEFFNIGV